MLLWALLTWLCRLGLSTWLVFLATLLTGRWALRCWRDMRSLPPGPWGLPVAGYLYFMGLGPKHSQFLSMAAKYGPVFSTQLGNQLMVVLSDYRLIRDAFRREEFTSRPDTPLMQALDGFGESFFMK